MQLHHSVLEHKQNINWYIPQSLTSRVIKIKKDLITLNFLFFQMICKEINTFFIFVRSMFKGEFEAHIKN